MKCRAELDQFDTLSVPPGVCRAFRNTSNEDGILQVLISGGVLDMTDIDFPPATADWLARYGDDVVKQFEERGFLFTAASG